MKMKTAGRSRHSKGQGVQLFYSRSVIGSSATVVPGRVFPMVKSCRLFPVEPESVIISMCYFGDNRAPVSRYSILRFPEKTIPESLEWLQPSRVEL